MSVKSILVTVFLILPACGNAAAADPGPGRSLNVSVRMEF
jgi:hypothetical protein